MRIPGHKVATKNSTNPDLHSWFCSNLVIGLPLQFETIFRESSIDLRNLQAPNDASFQKNLLIAYLGRDCRKISRFMFKKLVEAWSKI